ncbi:MAG: hypothetical protein R3D71_05275 [Rickettsiales bacterium]
MASKITEDTYRLAFINSLYDAAGVDYRDYKNFPNETQLKDIFRNKFNAEITNGVLHGTQAPDIRLVSSILASDNIDAKHAMKIFKASITTTNYFNSETNNLRVEPFNVDIKKRYIDKSDRKYLEQTLLEKGGLSDRDVLLVIDRLIPERDKSANHKNETKNRLEDVDHQENLESFIKQKLGIKELAQAPNAVMSVLSDKQKSKIPSELLKRNTSGEIAPSRRILKDILIDNVSITPDKSEEVVDRLLPLWKKKSFEDLVIDYDNTEHGKKSFSGLLKFVKKEWNVGDSKELAQILGITDEVVNGYNAGENEDKKPIHATLKKIADSHNISKDSLNRLRTISKGNNKNLPAIVYTVESLIKKTDDIHEKNRILAGFFTQALDAVGHSDYSFAREYGTEATHVNKLRKYDKDNPSGSLYNVRLGSAERIAKVLTDDSKLSYRITKLLLKVPEKDVDELLNKARDKLKGIERSEHKGEIIADFFKKSLIINNTTADGFKEKHGFDYSVVKNLTNGSYKNGIAPIDIIKRTANALTTDKETASNVMLVMSGIADKSKPFSELMDDVIQGNKKLDESITQLRIQKGESEDKFFSEVGSSHKFFKKIKNNQNVTLGNLKNLLTNINNQQPEDEQASQETINTVVEKYARYTSPSTKIDGIKEAKSKAELITAQGHR